MQVKYGSSLVVARRSDENIPDGLIDLKELVICEHTFSIFNGVHKTVSPKEVCPNV